MPEIRSSSMSAPHRASNRKGDETHESIKSKEQPSTMEIMAGKPLKSKRDYPVAKGVEPPPTDTADASDLARRRKIVLIAGIVFGLMFLISVGVLGRMLFSGGKIDRDSAVALDNLRKAQRTWWDTEGIAQGPADPDAAL